MISVAISPRKWQFRMWWRDQVQEVRRTDARSRRHPPKSPSNICPALYAEKVCGPCALNESIRRTESGGRVSLHERSRWTHSILCPSVSYVCITSCTVPAGLPTCPRTTRPSRCESGVKNSYKIVHARDWQYLNRNTVSSCGKF